MFSKKILVSLMVIGMAGALATSGTLAFFSDTEASTDNTFTAGSIDAEFSPVDYFPSSETFGAISGEDTNISVGDIKPGDTKDKRYFGFEVTDNPSYVCMAVTNVDDLEGENPPTDPEQEAGDFSAPEGELSDYLRFTVYGEPDNREVGTGTVPVSTGVFEVVDADYSLFSDLDNFDPYPAGRTEYLSVEVSMVTEDPNGDINVAQTDQVEADVALYATQSRNRDGSDGDQGPEGFDCNDNLTVQGGEIVPVEP